jgi:hypothetical protein
LKVHMSTLISEVFWTCACGTKMKAILHMSDTSVTLRCPTPSCKITRTLPGQITKLSLETEPGVWRGVDVSAQMPCKEKAVLFAA